MQTLCMSDLLHSAPHMQQSLPRYKFCLAHHYSNRPLFFDKVALEAVVKTRADGLATRDTPSFASKAHCGLLLAAPVY